MKNENQPPISYLDRKIASLLIKLKNIDIKKFLIKLKNIDIKKFKLIEIKKEHYTPLAIILGAIIISIAIYLGSSTEYRSQKKSCIALSGENYKKMKSNVRQVWLTACMNNFK